MALDPPTHFQMLFGCLEFILTSQHPLAGHVNIVITLIFRFLGYGFDSVLKEAVL